MVDNHTVFWGFLENAKKLSDINTTLRTTGSELNSTLADIRDAINPEAKERLIAYNKWLEEQQYAKDFENFLMRFRRHPVSRSAIVSQSRLSMLNDAVDAGYLEEIDEDMCLTEDGKQFLQTLDDIKKKAEKYKEDLEHEKHVFEYGLIDNHKYAEEEEIEAHMTPGSWILLGIVFVIAAIIAIFG